MSSRKIHVYADGEPILTEKGGAVFLPTLHGLDSVGRRKVWTISVEDTTIVTRHGLYGSGAIQVDQVTLTEGKNIGRTNETTAHEQAMKEATSKWKKKQLDGSYTHDESTLYDVRVVPRPMLAQKFEKAKHRMNYPAAFQPKLDGIRMLTVVKKDGIEFYTRKLKRILTVDHLIPSVSGMFKPGIILDGELFNPELTLQQISGASKKHKDGVTEKLQYWVYDVVNDLAFKDRFQELRLKEDPHGRVVIVDTNIVPSEAVVWRMFATARANGFEGGIVRALEDPYKEGSRSAGLQKVKAWEDGEFTIVGFKDGVGRSKGAVIWECKMPSDQGGRTFEVVPMGSMLLRQDWFLRGKDFIGKNLTVKFAGYTPDGVPFHPTGVVVRDYE